MVTKVYSTVYCSKRNNSDIVADRFGYLYSTSKILERVFFKEILGEYT